MALADTAGSGAEWSQRWCRCRVKADIHEIIRELAMSGIGVVVISDDLPELLATCGRISGYEGRADRQHGQGRRDERNRTCGKAGIMNILP